MFKRRQSTRARRNRATRVLALGLAAGALVGAASPTLARADLPPANHGAVLAAISDVIRSGAPAFVIRGVDETGHWSAAAGVARLHTGPQASPDAAFRIGSISKTFVAVAILQLVNEGRIGLDVPIDHYLPGLLARGDVITIRELLEHRAGLGPTPLPTNYSIDGLCRTDYDPVAVVKAADIQLFEPGTSWLYSNPGYTALELVIEKVTGKPYEQVVRQQIIRPLGLRHTSFQEDAPNWPRPYLHGYTDYAASDNVFAGDMVDRTNCKFSLVGAAGSGISTTRDLLTFWHALLNGRLLPDSLYQQMIDAVPIEGDPGVGYGLGIFRQTFACGVELIGNTGGVFGYESELVSTLDGSRAMAYGLSVFPGTLITDSSLEAVTQAEFCGTSHA